MRLGERWGREIVCDLSREIPNMVRWCLSTLSHVWCGGTVIAHVLHCPSCQGTDIVRHGTTPEGKQRYQCRECLLGRGRTFLLAYPYAGQSPEVKQPIVEMAINARGRRDTARVLHVSPTTL
jgi:transposase-like protein